MSLTRGSIAKIDFPDLLRNLCNVMQNVCTFTKFSYWDTKNELIFFYIYIFVLYLLYL